jgi:tetratricopeptide (TPR) repeat protein
VEEKVMGRIIVLTALLSLTAQADDRAAAREHYRQGMKAYDLGHYADAAKEFEAAYQALEDPTLLFNLAQAYRFAGDYAAAIRSYKSYLRHVPNSPQRGEVEARITELQKLFDDQTRMNQKPPSGALAPPGEPHPIAPPPSTPAPQVTHRPWPPARPLKIAGLSIAGVGVASLVLGGVFAGLASSAHSDANRGSNGVFDPAAEDRMNLYQSLDASFFAVGGVLVAGGLAAFLVGQLHSPVEVSASAAPGGARAQLEVHFQ